VTNEEHVNLSIYDLRKRKWLRNPLGKRILEHCPCARFKVFCRA